jgi:hypothetical protein
MTKSGIMTATNTSDPKFSFKKASVQPDSILGITVDRKHAAKCLFPQEKGTLHAPQKVYMYSQNAQIPPDAAAR